jgi:hypothetical protein
MMIFADVVGSIMTFGVAAKTVPNVIVMLHASAPRLIVHDDDPL